MRQSQGPCGCQGVVPNCPCPSLDAVLWKAGLCLTEKAQWSWPWWEGAGELTLPGICRGMAQEQRSCPSSPTPRPRHLWQLGKQSTEGFMGPGELSLSSANYTLRRAHSASSRQHSRVGPGGAANKGVRAGEPLQFLIGCSPWESGALALTGKHSAAGSGGVGMKELSPRA